MIFCGASASIRAASSIADRCSFQMAVETAGLREVSLIVDAASMANRYHKGRRPMCSRRGLSPRLTEHSGVDQVHFCDLVVTDGPSPGTFQARLIGSHRAVVSCGADFLCGGGAASHATASETIRNSTVAAFPCIKRRV